MTGMNIQMVIMRKCGALLTAGALLAALAAGVQCAPPAARSVASAPNAGGALGSLLKQLSASATTTSTTTTAAAAGGSNKPTAGGLKALGDSASGQAGPRDGATVNAEDQLNTFDGKNPFGDDSLWQIPIHLVRDASDSSAATANGDALKAAAGRGEPLAKSASELTAAAAVERDQLERDDAAAAADADDDDDGDAAAMGSDEQRDTTSILAHQRAGAPLARASSPSAPTVISASTDLKTAAGYHHATPHHHGHYDGHHHGGHHHDGGGHYGNYFQYASVPYPYAWDFGYRRGNPYHTIERYEHGKGPHFQTKVKWADKHGGYGVHVWDYNHDDHSAHHYGHGHDGAHYDSHAPAHHYGAGGHHHASHYPGHH